MKNKYKLFYPDIVSIKGVVNINPKLKGKSLMVFLSKVSLSDSYSGYFLKKREFDLLSYPNADVSKFSNLLSFPEYCRSHYLLSRSEGSSIYVSVEGLSFVRIDDGRVVNYARCKDKTSLIEYAKQMEISVQVHGEDSVFYFDRPIESLEGKLIRYDDKNVFNCIKETQVVNPLSFFKRLLSSAGDLLKRKFSKIKKLKTSKKKDNRLSPNNTKLFVIFSSLVVATVVAFGGYKLYHANEVYKSNLINKLNVVNSNMGALNHKLITISDNIDYQNKNIHRMDADLKYIKSAIDETKVSTQTLDGKIESVGKYSDLAEMKETIGFISKSIKKQQSQIKGLYNEFKSLEKIMSYSNVENKKPAGKARVTHGMEYSKDVPHFFCKPVIVNDESVLCEYKGSKFNISKKPQYIDKRLVSYIPKEKAFLIRDGNKIRKTPLSMAKRGFE